MSKILTSKLLTKMISCYEEIIEYLYSSVKKYWNELIIEKITVTANIATVSPTLQISHWIMWTYVTKLRERSVPNVIRIFPNVTKLVMKFVNFVTLSIILDERCRKGPQCKDLKKIVYENESPKRPAKYLGMVSFLNCCWNF